MQKHYTPQLAEAEKKALRAGVTSGQLSTLKAKVMGVHYARPDAKNMPGTSHHVLGVAMEFNMHVIGSFNPEIMAAVNAFADEYHRWTVANEYLASADAFESNLPSLLPHLSASEIQEIKETIANAAVRLAKPDTILHLHNMTIRFIRGQPMEKIREILAECLENLEEQGYFMRPLDQPHD